MEERLPLVTIMGPTGVGKTDLAISLSKTVSSQIIGVDSVQVYKGMDIGSGKPSKDTLDRYPHKLVSFIDPWKSYSTALFILDASREINLCDRSNKVPLLVGGTMLYFRSLLSGISRMPEANQEVRNEISDQEKKTDGGSCTKNYRKSIQNLLKGYIPMTLSEYKEPWKSIGLALKP